MTGNRISRRILVRGAAGLVAAPFLPPGLGRAASGGAPIALEAATRTIEVKGKAAKVYSLAAAAAAEPGLGFTLGEDFRVRLTNRLAEPTLIHWHGLTPPSAQDGVPGLSQDPIAAGAAYDYDFPLTRPGTYWMHSHFNLEQTQRLMSAPLIIRTREDLARDEQEVVILLNDFTFRDPNEILAALQGRGGASPSAGGMSGGMGAMSMGGMKMSGMKMGPPGDAAGRKGAMAMGASKAGGGSMDANDVDFDAYLANHRTLEDPEVVQVEPKARVRLRIINGADSTSFFLDLGALEGELIAVDGQEIAPVRGRRFPMAMAQRLDIRLTLPAGQGSYPVLAQREADAPRTGIVLATKGAAVKRIAAEAASKAGMVGLELERTLRPIRPLAQRAADRTHEVLLGGDMARYVWTMNGKVYGEDTPLPVAQGERVELVLKNTTAMSHPMHLHGTIFQVVAIDGKRINGARRDTVMVPRQTAVTIAFDADNPGRWAFHCHNAYHQEAGMMTSVRYI